MRVETQQLLAQVGGTPVAAAHQRLGRLAANPAQVGTQREVGRQLRLQAAAQGLVGLGHAALAHLFGAVGQEAIVRVEGGGFGRGLHAAGTVY